MSQKTQGLDEPTPDVVRIALAGQPNVGKSTIFNMLTGLDQHVGNWPGKTVEQKTGHFLLHGSAVHLTDLPGTYALTADSEEERIAREHILVDRPDVVIVIANAAALESSLYLLTELLALDVPVVLGLNMMDVAEGQGRHIEPQVLAATLRLPVVPVTASRNRGVRELVTAALDLSRSSTPFSPARPALGKEHQAALETIQTELAGCVPFPYPLPWVALKLLEGDVDITRQVQEWAPEVWTSIRGLLARHEDVYLDIASGRYGWIARMTRAAETRPRLGTLVLTDRIDRIATHPIWGIGVLSAIVALVFWVTYAVALPASRWLQTGVVAPSSDIVRHGLAGAPEWVSGLIVSGAMGGVGLVLSFLPVLVVFYLVLGVGEDTGYLARAAYVTDRYMHLMGLHGRSSLPLALGFGCNVPAILGTRILEDRRARTLTILLTPFVPCTGRLAVVAFLAPALFGAHATLASCALVGLNLLVLVAVGVTLSSLVFRSERAPFIMTMPIYHAPSPRTVGLFALSNCIAFIRRAGSVILVTSCLVWALSALPDGDIQHSYLAHIGRFVQPAGQCIGLADWRYPVALLTGLVAKENAVATLGVLFPPDHAARGSAAASHAMPVAAGLSFLVVQMLFIPCVPTLTCIRCETGRLRWVAASLLLQLVVSLAAALLVYRLALLVF